jgi:hypothetical protein
MPQNIRIERPSQTIKSNITPLSSDLKVKISAAFQTIVNKIKDKHLS